MDGGDGVWVARAHGARRAPKVKRVARALCALVALVSAGGEARPASIQVEPDPKQPPPLPPQPVLRGDGLWIGGACFPPCGFPERTDPDSNGDLDGWGFELQRACVVLGTTPTLDAPRCDVAPPPPLPPPGDGVFREGTCHPRCSSSITDRDEHGKLDGWGYERRRPCVITGSAAALGGVPCEPDVPDYPPGDGVEIPIDAQGTVACRPLCLRPLESDPDGDGYGYEAHTSCIVSASIPALQGIPCDAEDLPAPKPVPKPPGAGWNSDYTASMFGEINCRGFGFDDPGDSDLERSTCISSGKLALDAHNSVYFGAVGDLSSSWNGAPCECTDGELGGKCKSPPACPGQTNCGVCVEVACNGSGKHSYQGSGITHNELCKPNQSVVVQLIDACPHNHPNNPYWCTEQRKNHIDVSCSAFSALTEGRDIGQIGHVNVHVRVVDCAAGLGVRRF